MVRKTAKLVAGRFFFQPQIQTEVQKLPGVKFCFEVYYSSKNWGFVGCALCGFGAYPLMVSCDASADGELGFNYHMRSHLAKPEKMPNLEIHILPAFEARHGKLYLENLS